MISNTYKDSIIYLSAVILSAFVISCQGVDESTEGQEEFTYPYKAVATVGMITDVVRNVAGDKAEVSGMIGEGVDPHLYKPTSSDVKLLQAADIIFYGGLNLEGKMADVLVRIAKGGKAVTSVTETLLESDDYVLSDEANHYDPHVWMDVGGWMKATEVVRDQLIAFDSRNEDLYRRNTADYLAELEKLDAYGKEMIK